MLMLGVCINTFVLISGYYGINLRVKSFLNLTGMVLFYSLLSSLSNIVIFWGGKRELYSKYILTHIP